MKKKIQKLNQLHKMVYDFWLIYGKNRINVEIDEKCAAMLNKLANLFWSMFDFGAADYNFDERRAIDWINKLINRPEDFLDQDILSHIDIWLMK